MYSSFYWGLFSSVIHCNKVLISVYDWDFTCMHIMLLHFLYFISMWDFMLAQLFLMHLSAFRRLNLQICIDLSVLCQSNNTCDLEVIIIKFDLVSPILAIAREAHVQASLILTTFVTKWCVIIVIHSKNTIVYYVMDISSVLIILEIVTHRHSIARWCFQWHLFVCGYVCL